jgi:hypothetical protein
VDITLDRPNSMSVAALSDSTNVEQSNSGGDCAKDNDFERRRARERLTGDGAPRRGRDGVNHHGRIAVLVTEFSR